MFCIKYWLQKKKSVLLDQTELNTRTLRAKLLDKRFESLKIEGAE